MPMNVWQNCGKNWPQVLSNKRGGDMPSFRFTHNFSGNLWEIQEFLQDVDGQSGFVNLLDELDTVVMPNLARFPEMGRLFMQRYGQSVEAALKLPTLKAKLNKLGLSGDLREYLMQNYLILYTFDRDICFFLSIKHHRQLGFDLTSFWGSGSYPANQASGGKLLLQQEREKYDTGR